ncbi:hypothetical protein RHMOL_Rhmol05G0152800 [Rhododendron molle]|nr:hypothetical protein RHMOL_Rhmol05G0152800 [Rhododendron molle]
MIQKLSTPKNCAIMLRASMYMYGTISQCVFTVHSIFDPTSQQQPLAESSTQNLHQTRQRSVGQNQTAQQNHQQTIAPCKKMHMLCL